jgi:F-type H+-transporting ATPase subunit alpha
MFPIGRGQRELIIGDRSTGKSAIGIDTIINQRDSDVISVYVAIGQRSSSVRQAIEAVRSYGAIQRTIFVVADADSPPGLQWLAPYAGMTIAEYFRDRGGHALVVIDDLTKHAAVHRELALLLRQAPGREAYPGDIFYIHARLLERAAKLSEKRGGGSLTALPIAETQAGNLSAYIPTNLISITDGQICLDSKLFYAGHHPAVDVGKSVSRVGGKTQAGAMRGLAEPLRLSYAQFLELETFARFGTIMDERTRRALEHGRRLRSMLQQAQYAPRPMEVQVAQLLALKQEIVDRVPLEQVPAFVAHLPQWLNAHAAEAMNKIKQIGELDDSARCALIAAMQSLAEQLAGEHQAKWEKKK